jgi:sugar lactone lactonase YvrE
MELLCNPHDQIGESPVWSVADQALYWCDIDGRRVHRLDWATRQTCTWNFVERVGCVALHTDGGLVAACESGIFHLRFKADKLLSTTLLARAPYAVDGLSRMRFNDGRCDRRGRLWVTTMVRDVERGEPAGGLYRLDANGLSGPHVHGLVTGNGLAFSPDGRTMYLSDSHPSVQRVWSFEVGDDCALSNRRVFIDRLPAPGRPDGAAVDAEGGYWVCANDAGYVLRYKANGVLDRTIATPVRKPSMCAFGGPDLGTLFITSIREVGNLASPLSGALFVARPGVSGIAECTFK